MSSPRAAPAMPPPEAACRPSSALSHLLRGALAHASRKDATEQPGCEASFFGVFSPRLQPSPGMPDVAPATICHVNWRMR